MVRYHSTLQPLKTRPDTPIDPRRRNSSHGCFPTTRSTAPLPSPSIVAARAYYLEQGTPIGPKIDALERRRSLIESHPLPRRHSATASPSILASQLESFGFSSSESELQPVPEAEEDSPKIKTEDQQDAIMAGVEQVVVVQTGTEPVQKKSEILPTEVLRHVPFEFTHDHLRDWGLAYLGNGSTADAFVNAVSLKRPSLSLAEEDAYQVKSSYLVTIRARVLPRAKERKPFLVQRQFDIDELRASIPEVKTHDQVGDIRSVSPTALRRSSRPPTRRSSVQPLEASKRYNNLNFHAPGRFLGEAAIPIHIEYALHYLPVLAALMLSGHVRKGDSIDLPLPHPEAWPDVVAYIYTGGGSPTDAMKENIRYLAGHA